MRGYRTIEEVAAAVGIAGAERVLEAKRAESPMGACLRRRALALPHDDPAREALIRLARTRPALVKRVVDPHHSPAARSAEEVRAALAGLGAERHAAVCRAHRTARPFRLLVRELAQAAEGEERELLFGLSRTSAALVGQVLAERPADDEGAPPQRPEADPDARPEVRAGFANRALREGLERLRPGLFPSP